MKNEHRNLSARKCQKGEVGSEAKGAPCDQDKAPGKERPWKGVRNCWGQSFRKKAQIRVYVRVPASCLF